MRNILTDKWTDRCRLMLVGPWLLTEEEEEIGIKICMETEKADVSRSMNDVAKKKKMYSYSSLSVPALC